MPFAEISLSVAGLLNRKQLVGLDSLKSGTLNLDIASPAQSAEQSNQRHWILVANSLSVLILA
ncbi:hypothetical protein NG798_15240 [Ancylothrix sp. C2]|nr:hypothetical protein [Ancylothrix sp. D3o]